MTARDWNLRSPFPDDEYLDPRSAEQRATDQRQVCRQVADLVRRPRDRAFRRELIALLQDRRAGRGDLVQFEAIPSRLGYDTLVVTGELLIRAEALGTDAVENLLRRYEFERLPVECLQERVVRLVNPGIRAARLDDIARLLRREGVPASVNHITPLGPIAKGLGGPEPSAGALPFPGDIGTTARQVRVAVIDTGIVERQRSDGWLNNVPRTGDNIDPLDALPGSGDGFLDWGAGHCTFAAGIVQQVAPRAEIHAYRALDSDGVGSEVDVACAMIRAVREGADILNLSLGTQTLQDQPPVAIEVALEIIGELERERRDRVLLVAAAGNFGDTRPCWPAAFRRVLSVAGLAADGRPAEWSNHGFWVDCSTIGEGLLSTYVEGDESPEIDPDPDHFGRDPWAVWTGTSFAAPQIVGAVAKRCDETGVAPRVALRELLANGVRIADYGRAVRILPGT